MADVANLLALLDAMVDNGTTLIVIEHNLDVVARAEGDLRHPTISALGTVGVNPVHDDTKLANRFAAAGVRRAA